MPARILNFFLVSLLVANLTACDSSSNPAPYANTVTRTTAYIEQQMAQNNIQGLSIALVDGQDVVWKKGFGYADVQSNTPSTPDTLYEIASISKTFTAAMIMQLVERNLVRLDDPLTNYIPTFSMNPTLGDFPFPDGTVTIQSILTHHSGIPGDLLNANLARVRYADYNSRLVNELNTDYASYPVDFALAYSNTAISFLADVIEAASAETFEEFSDTLLDQIGMTHALGLPWVGITGQPVLQVVVIDHLAPFGVDYADQIVTGIQVRGQSTVCAVQPLLHRLHEATGHIVVEQQAAPTRWTVDSAQRVWRADEPGIAPGHVRVVV